MLIAPEILPLAAEGLASDVATDARPLDVPGEPLFTESKAGSKLTREPPAKPPGDPTLPGLVPEDVYISDCVLFFGLFFVGLLGGAASPRA